LTPTLSSTAELLSCSRPTEELSPVRELQHGTHGSRHRLDLCLAASVARFRRWQGQAQQTLRANYWFSDRDNRNRYLLRGLVKWGLCGLNYIGGIGSGAGHPYYKCSSQSNARSLYGRQGLRCPGKALRADQIEAIIWDDIEGFLRHPGTVLERLAEQLEGETNAADHQQEEVDHLSTLLTG
jgi:hypothetical protein